MLEDSVTMRSAVEQLRRPRNSQDKYMLFYNMASSEALNESAMPAATSAAAALLSCFHSEIFEKAH